MPKCQLSTDHMAQVIQLLALKETQKDIAEKFEVSIKTIRNISRRFREEGTITRKTYRRQGMIGPAKIFDLKKYVSDKPFDTLKEIKTNLNLPASSPTISRRLKECDLTCKVGPRKFLISHLHQEERLNTTIRRRFWSPTYLEKIVFTDESGMDNSGVQRKLVRRLRGRRNDIRFTYRYPNKTLRVNYFSWIPIKGTGGLYFYSRMDSSLYCEIIEDMVSKLKEIFGNKDFLIAHDNARFSNSESTIRRPSVIRRLPTHYVHPCLMPAA